MTDKPFTSTALKWLKVKKFFINCRVVEWIVENFDSIDSFFNQSEKALLNKGWPRLMLADWRSARQYNEKNFIALLRSNEMRLLCIEDKAYPFLLKAIKNPPPVLFYKGDISCVCDNTISIVGSRNCSKEGVSITQEIARLLASNGYTIVSGLAIGIDTAAHKGAVKTGRTAAILGCGLDISYPLANRFLSEEIQSKGCVISEYFWGEQPFKLNFPYRNRIISGLSQSLIVIEAGEKSGALITANFALEQGREVLAVPGNPLERYSKGCNSLIKEGAFLIDELNDLEYFFDINSKKPTKEQLDDPVLKMLTQKPYSLEELVNLTKNSASKLLAHLTVLEIKQLISKNNKNKYYRILT